MTTCCPLQEHDGDLAEMSDTKMVRARKAHRCCECRRTIAAGTLHERCKLLYDGTWSCFRTCLICHEIREHFRCGQSFTFELLWEQLEENLLPTMTAGGECLFGLSPAAKGYLFERCLASKERIRAWQLREDNVIADLEHAGLRGRALARRAWGLA